MDSDEFDDDILDEDLILAADQAAPSARATKSPTTAVVPLRAPTVGENGFSSRPSNHTGTAARRSSANFIDLDDFPSDAFSSPPRETASAVQPAYRNLIAPPSRLGGPAQGFRQTTLFGAKIPRNGVEPTSQSRVSNRVFRADLPVEAPTHHELNNEALKSWVYPTNLGAIRDYQYTIVKEGLFNNTLVALPTGLGKTFIAATVMLNFFRWTKTAKIIFVAPTKPLVSQQVDACFNIVGIPRSETTLLTGEVSPTLRAEEWQTKRVFFMTPQTLENDLSHGIADPKSICLLVVDEAHRATGNYAYVKVVNFIRRFSSSFRVLALTATPGSNVEAVQEVIDGLGISHVEIRTENSIDIKPHVNHREEEVILLDPTDEMITIQDLFSKALKPLVDKLSQQNIYYGRDPMALTTFGLLKARKDWLARAGQHANQGIKFMMMAIFSILQSLAHSIKLLNFHGIKPFYDNLVQFRNETEGKGEKGSKFKRQVIESPDFQKMMSMVRAWTSKDGFVSHPKITNLCETVLNHFMDAGDGRENSISSNTRIIVFSEYRDSAEEIVRVLNRHKPLIRAAVFVGQADTKNSEGMKQSEQIERIRKFQDGSFNVLVATSIGEEGLDIGQVDLIVCYDASASPIRMLQRMGRTGRKRAGRVVLLLMQREKDKYLESKDAYNRMQDMICDGQRFAFRHDLSKRIVPRDTKPEVDKRHVDIPIENTQNHSLPEPKRGGARKKRPPKKFHMPDGVETGFTSVASMLGTRTTKDKSPPAPCEEDEVAVIPDLERVVLDNKKTHELQQHYQYVPFYQDRIQEIETVDPAANPVAQRLLHKTVLLKHGEHTKRCVRLFQILSRIHSGVLRHLELYGNSNPRALSPMEGFDSAVEMEPAMPPAAKRRRVNKSDSAQPQRSGQARNTQPKTSKTSKAKSSRAKQDLIGYEYLGEDDMEDEGLREQETELTSEPLQPPQRRKPGRPKGSINKPAQPKRGRPRKKQLSKVYDESADEGDDCRRTSDLELSDDSDDGSDLVDFIVGDDEATSSAVAPTSSMRQESVCSATPPSSSLPRRKHASDYYQPTQFTESEGSDKDMPSMSQLLRKSQQSKTSSLRQSDTEEAPVARNPRRAKRRVVFDEDESSDD
ncbi:hypothetical protein BX600DRAFT_432241 [Xylariales sp. PMI_506]|nr:hypothetical protein BX600DRAFT_432241 [Xylariales sp. PMI_506]